MKSPHVLNLKYFFLFLRISVGPTSWYVIGVPFASDSKRIKKYYLGFQLCALIMFPKTPLEWLLVEFDFIGTKQKLNDIQFKLTNTVEYIISKILCH